MTICGHFDSPRFKSYSISTLTGNASFESDHGEQQKPPSVFSEKSNLSDDSDDDDHAQFDKIVNLILKPKDIIVYFDDNEPDNPHFELLLPPPKLV